MPRSWYLLAQQLKDAYLLSGLRRAALGRCVLPWPVFQGLWAAFGAVLLLAAQSRWRDRPSPILRDPRDLGNVYIPFRPAPALVVGLTRLRLPRYSPSRKAVSQRCVSVVRCTSGVDEGGDRGRSPWVSSPRRWSGLGQLGSVPPDLDGGLGGFHGDLQASWSWSGRRADRAWLLAPAILLALCQYFEWWFRSRVLVPRLLIAFPQPSRHSRDAGTLNPNVDKHSLNSSN